MSSWCPVGGACACIVAERGCTCVCVAQRVFGVHAFDRSQLDRLLDLADANRDGKLDYAEFAQRFSSKGSHHDWQRHVVRRLQAHCEEVTWLWLWLWLWWWWWWWWRS